MNDTFLIIFQYTIYNVVNKKISQYALQYNQSFDCLCFY
jgi:hypothetical protein